MRNSKLLLLTVACFSIYAEAGVENEVKMKMKYRLDPDCRYTLVSEVTIPSTIQSAKEFISSEIMNPAINFASSDKDEVLGYQLNKATDGYEQIIKVKKNGFSTRIYSACSNLLGDEQEASFVCIVDTKKTKFKGMIKLFKENETRIECSKADTNIMKCTFRTIGRANSIPFFGDSCDLAAPGASDTFKATYRLAHYLTYGNVDSLRSGDSAISRLYLKAKDHPDRGKVKVLINEEIK
jgi:hypothetical protein